MRTLRIIQSALLICFLAPAARANGAGAAGSDTVLATFHVDISRSIASGGLTPGDTVLVRYDSLPVPAPPYHDLLLTHVFGAIYSGTESLFVPAGDTIYYHYMTPGIGGYASEIAYFPYLGSTERAYVIPGQSPLIYDTSTCLTCARRQPYFVNTKALQRVVSVLWEVDVRPALYKVAMGDTLPDLEGAVTVSSADSVLRSGVFINGPATGGWQKWDAALRHDTTRLMYDDGSHGDIVGGDSVFSRIILAAPESLLIGTKGQVGQVFKFSIGGGDNEGGPASFGVNHYDNIIDTGPRFTLYEQWGSTNPAFYSFWDYYWHTPVVSVRLPGPIPEHPQGSILYQNYPNPFNPESTIRYDLPQAAHVRLELYNIVGERVMVLVDSRQVAGPHAVRLSAGALSSGTYFYRISAGGFVRSGSCVLLR